MQEKSTLPVGVSVLLLNGEGKVLLGERVNVSAAGLLSTPGGRIEQNETMFECAHRELLEETGVDVHPGAFRLLGFKEHFRFGNHYIMIYVTAFHYGTVVNKEPEKCKGWEWMDINGILPDRCTEPQDILELVNKVRIL
jgi:8-oxo-dGTP diphosphatase